MEFESDKSRFEFIVNSMTNSFGILHSLKLDYNSKLTEVIKKFLPDEQYKELLTYLTEDTVFNVAISNDIDTTFAGNDIIWIKYDPEQTFGSILIPLPNKECFVFKYSLNKNIV